MRRRVKMATTAAAAQHLLGGRHAQHMRRDGENNRELRHRAGHATALCQSVRGGQHDDRHDGSSQREGAHGDSYQ